MESYTRRSTLKIDYVIVVLFLMLIAFGLINIYASSYNFDNVGMFDWSERSGRQLIWAGLSLFIGIIIMFIDTKYFEQLSYLIYSLTCILLFATIFIGSYTKGSNSWIELGPVKLQPAEFAKFATSLALAKCMSSYQFNLMRPQSYIPAIAIVLLPICLIILQKETGSALVYTSLILVFYLQGMTPKILISGILAIVYFITTIKYEEWVWGNTEMGLYITSSIILVVLVFYPYISKSNRRIADRQLFANILILIIAHSVNYFYKFNMGYLLLLQILFSAIYLTYNGFISKNPNFKFSGLLAITSLIFIFSIHFVFDNIIQPHQQTRLRVSFGIEDDPAGAGYNVNQSMIAIGSGGAMGKGFLNGTQTKLKYVPEQDTDFIFCTVGEEYGFVGSSIVLILFFTLIIRIIMLSEKMKSRFAKIYGYCVASIIAFHVIINIGMVIGIIPVIGIPLPFFSYGGSSLWGFSILLFIFLKLQSSNIK